MIKKIATKLLLCAALPILGMCSLNAEPEAVRVLLITGHNNHNWKATTPLIVKALESTGRFKVEVNEKIESFDIKNFENFDVIFSHWNLWKHIKNMPPELDWSPELRKAYVEFVKSGGGHVAIHAGSSTFYEWDDYQEICVATWKNGTHHGPNHVFEVRIDEPDHPVTKGLSNFEKYDELWEKMYVSSRKATVLTSSFASKEFKGDDVWEASTFVSKFGKGRTAYTSFGHDPQSFQSKDFKVLLARLVEWAATGEVTIPAPEK